MGTSGRFPAFTRGIVTVGFEHGAEACECPGGGGGVDCYQPCSGEVDEVMEHIGVCHSVYSSIDGDEEEKDTCEVAEAGGHSWDHFAACQGFNKEEEWHDGKDVVVRRERRQPVDGKVVHPHHEDR